MKCDYADYAQHTGECCGPVEMRKAMTAYHFEGERNSAQDPNRDFLACHYHWEGYEEFWKSQWDEYFNATRC